MLSMEKREFWFGLWEGGCGRLVRRFGDWVCGVDVGASAEAGWGFGMASRIKLCILERESLDTVKSTV